MILRPVLEACRANRRPEEESAEKARLAGLRRGEERRSKGGGSRRNVEKLALRRGSHGQGKRLQRHGARKIVRSSFFEIYHGAIIGKYLNKNSNARDV